MSCAISHYPVLFLTIGAIVHQIKNPH
ncbi:glycerophosphocholine phosphodiesterase [Escherichia phage IMM-001]|nr:glycerophosphocholine phosphodiesterase [Escherichia phage IMM-001]